MVIGIIGQSIGTLSGIASQPSGVAGLVALTLGGVTFGGFEVPDELDRFGGTQKLVVHDFPGGQRSVQTFGAFPPRIIRWSGVFFEGDVGAALDRCDQLNSMRANGQVQQLTFERFQYQVIVHDFRPQPRSIYRIPYDIELVPTQDNTASSLQLPGPPNAVTQLAQQNNELPTLAQEIASSTGDLGAQAASSQLTTFQQQLNNALQQSNGSLSNVNSSSLQTSLNQTRGAVGTLANSTNSALAGASLQASAALGNINNTLASNTGGIITTLTLINPNLRALALEYYGDASKWNVIAQANKIAVPNPIGIFADTTAIVIPKLPS